MSIKVFWWVLLVAQLLIYGGHTPLGNLPHYGDVQAGCFAIAWGSVVVLIYGYNCKKKNKKFNKLVALLLFSFFAVIMGVLSFVYGMGGYFLGVWVAFLSLMTFFFTLTLSIRTLVFVREGK